MEMLFWHVNKYFVFKLNWSIDQLYIDLFISAAGSSTLDMHLFLLF